MIKLIFLDADDTFLTPPYAAVRRASYLLGSRDFPTEHQFINRRHIEFYEAFPREFKSKKAMWLRAFLALPFGLFRSYKLFDDIQKESLANVLAQDNVYVVSKNPPSFARSRIKRIFDITGVKLGSRYIACGPIIRKSTPKIDIIKRIAAQRSIPLDQCLLVDDSVDNILEAARDGVQGLLINAAWNQNADLSSVRVGLITRTNRDEFVEKVQGYIVSNSIATATKDVIFVTPDQNTNHVIQDYKKQNLPAKHLPLQKRSKFRIFKKDPHNFSIDQFIKLITEGRLLDSEIVLCDNSGFQRTLTLFEKKRFVPKQPELTLVSAIKLRSYCKDIFAEQGHSFELSSFFNLYYRSRETFIKNIRADSALETALIAFMKSESITRTEAEETLRRHLNSVVYIRSYRACVIGFHVLDFIMSKLLRKIQINFPDNIKDVEESCFTIYAPIHRSYLDSGILGVELARARQQYPYTVAADKMLKVWLGRIGSYIGVFFVARRKVDDLYSAVLKAYLKQIQLEGGCLQVFIEGARSRSGLTLPPKRGIINSIDANRDVLKEQKIAIVPVAFAYNKLPESEILLNEVYEERRKEGKTSLKEQADFLVRTSAKVTKKQKFRGLIRKMRSAKVSDCYIEFGEAVYLGSEKCLVNIAPLNQKELTVQDTLNEVMYRINKMTPVLPSSVLAMILLTSNDHHTTYEKVREFMVLSRRLMGLYELPSHLLYDGAEIDSLIDESLRLPFINRKFKRVGVQENWIVSLTELDSTRATHYKNNILHYFVLPATLANIMVYSTTPVKKEELHRYLDHLFQDLSVRYFLPGTGKIDVLINEIIDIYLESGFITRHGESFLFTGESDKTEPFTMLSALAEDFAKSDLMNAFSRFRRAFQRLEIDLPSTLRHLGEDSIVTVKNLSAGGALIAFDSSQAIKGQEVTLSLTLEGKVFHYKGLINRVEEYGAGIQFIDVDDIGHHVLLAIMKSHSWENAGSVSPSQKAV